MGDAVAGLTDMEELLGRIQNKTMVGYLREAIACYHTGAYRACIVLSYIALFDDLGQKLHELAKTSAKAKTISIDVKQRQSDQKIFETYMVDQLKASKLITEAEASVLEQVRVCRNKAAHPSGVHASPEEARYVFFEVIDKFLSKKLLLTTQAVDALMARLENANFFPTMDIKEHKAIVESELTDLHEAVYPYLVEQLVDGSVSANQTTATNASRFLVGLAYLQREELTAHIHKRLVKLKAEDPDYRMVIVRAASVNAAVLTGHDTPTAIRIKSLLNAAIDNANPADAVTRLTHPVYLFGSLLTLGENKVLEEFGDAARKIVIKYRFTGSLVNGLADAPELKKTWLAKLKEEAGSATFETANRFATNVPDIDDHFPGVIEQHDALELVAAVCMQPTLVPSPPEIYALAAFLPFQN